MFSDVSVWHEKLITVRIIYLLYLGVIATDFLLALLFPGTLAMTMQEVREDDFQTEMDERHARMADTCSS